MRKFEGMKKLLSIFLCAVMVLSCLPVGALAAQGDACTLTADCTGVLDAEGVCSVCGKTEKPAHAHMYQVTYAQKDDSVHTLTRACLSCPEDAAERADEAHSYVNGLCVCGKEAPHQHSYVNGVCGCGEVCAHAEYAEGVCTLCGGLEPHSHSYVNGVCECGTACAHETYAEGICTVCGAAEPVQEESEPVCVCEVSCGGDNGINPNCVVCLEDFWNCTHFVPTCTCAEKCSEEEPNLWCAICGTEGAEKCEGKDKGIVLDEHKHALNGGEGDVVWTAWESNNSLPATAGNYYLTKNVNLSSVVWDVPAGETKICLNGMELKAKKINIVSGNTLTISDCGETGTVKRNGGFGQSGTVVENAGTFNLYGGSIRGNTNWYGYGGGVINNGTFNMYGGAVMKNSADRMGGGVYNASGATFNLYGGSITGNSGGTGGGLYNSGRFNMYGGSITGNTTDMDSYGGIYSANKIYVSGKVVISGNTAKGGKVSNYCSANNGAVIEINGSLEAGSSIGVTRYKEVGTITSGGADYIDYFFSDNAQYFVEKDGENLKLSEKEFTFTVTSNNKEYGTASANPTTAKKGTYVHLSAVPAKGYRLKEYQVISGGVTLFQLNDGSWRFLSGTEDVQIQAVFEEITDYGITVASDIENGGITVAVNGAVANSAAAGETVTLTVTPVEGYELDTLSYSDGTNTTAVTKDDEGKFTFTMPASNVTVTATFKSTAVLVTDIILAAPASMYVGQTAEIGVTVTPSNATNKTLKWESSDTSVATVDADGNVTAIGPGTATITVTAQDGSGVSATCNVSVSYYPANISNLSISGQTYEKDGVYWFQQDGNATVTPAEGFAVSTAKDGTFGNDITLGKSDTKTVYLKHIATGGQTGAIGLSRILEWDTTIPTGTIKLGTLSLYPNDSNDIIVKKEGNQTVTITGIDNESGVASIQYHIATATKNPAEIPDSDWQEYNGAIPLEDEGTYVVYAKITDNVGNKAYVNSGSITLDGTAPTISGVENGKTYYTTQTVTAQDTGSGVEGLYVNGVKSANGVISGNPPTDTEYIIYAKDTVGNESSKIKITMKPIATLAEGLPTVDTVKIEDEANIKALRDQVADMALKISSYNSEREALNAITDQCNTLLGMIERAKAVRDLIAALPDPSTVEPDEKKHIDACEAAMKALDNLDKNELRMVGSLDKLTKVYEALTAYDIIKGHKSNYVKGSYKALTITANGYFGKFVGVEVDGKTLDPKYYTAETAESGSTIITLKTSYLESLKSGKHYVTVVYTDGDTGGEEYFRVSVNNGSPMTGDNSHPLLFTGMAVTALLAMAMLLLFLPGKKGKYQR